MTGQSCSPGRARATGAHPLPLIIALLLLRALPATGGSCWSKVNSLGRCKEMLSQGVTREQCCSSRHLPDPPTTTTTTLMTAYSDEDYDNGALFFWQVLGGGVKCDSCSSSCEGVRCPAGRRCVLRRGAPRCLCNDCAPARHRRAQQQTPVCGSDGNTYKSACHLRGMVCRTGRAISIAYRGPCAGSCAGVRCRHGRSCLLDQNLSAHCVKCSRRCSPGAEQAELARGPVGGLLGHLHQPPLDDEFGLCGVDGKTYKSYCQLRAEACRSGRAIAIAYRGPCEHRDCSSVQCRPGQLCLQEAGTSRPRCVTCLYRCPRSRELTRERNRRREHRDNSPPALCASNNLTYPSWCHIIKESCFTGIVLETRHAGPCNAKDPPPFHSSSIRISNAGSKKKNYNHTGKSDGASMETKIATKSLHASGKKNIAYSKTTAKDGTFTVS
ncbi:follistatin-A [Copidosoma floridanum]|uniref:follistatin-A n=1 Tax=Copidosoma floridanum TaxID=29053 RepID=UPI0006C9B8CD|nr:follistatin-A [Copidosoma floridanum]